MFPASFQALTTAIWGVLKAKTSYLQVSTVSVMLAYGAQFSWVPGKGKKGDPENEIGPSFCGELM